MTNDLAYYATASVRKRNALITLNQIKTKTRADVGKHFLGVNYGTLTFSITALGIMKFSAVTRSIMTLSVMALSTMRLGIIIIQQITQVYH